MFSAQPLARQQGQVGAFGVAQRESPVQFLLGEQAGFDGLGQFDLSFGGQQRDPADFAQVDPDKIADDRPADLFDLLALRRGLRILMNGVHYLDTFGGEHAHDAIERLSRHVARIDGDGDVSDRHGTLLPGPCYQVRHGVTGPSRGGQ